LAKQVLLNRTELAGVGKIFHENQFVCPNPPSFVRINSGSKLIFFTPGTCPAISRRDGANEEN
jgi:hypothetical protein